MSERLSEFTYLSLGAGLQSSALLWMSCNGMAPRADVAIFADTHGEPEWVYEQLDALRKLSDIPIAVVSAGDLAQDVIDRHRGERSRFAAIPVFTRGSDGKAAPLRRQCTREYKIDPIQKEVRRLMGYKPRQRIPVDSVTALIGISLDEWKRAGDSKQRWVRNEYPLIDQGIRRGDCAKLLSDAGWPVPKKSSCVFCPYHSDFFWAELQRDNPEEFAKAVEFDGVVRYMSMGGVNNPTFLHRSLKPLSEVDFTKGQPGLFDEECHGVCGV